MSLLLEDVIKEYEYHCEARGMTRKTMINKRQEHKQLRQFLIQKRGITQLESITTFDLRAYVRLKQQQGLQATSIHSMFRMVKAFFSWCEREGYLKENIAQKVELPKQPIKVLEGFTNKEVKDMIDAFTFKNYLECRNKAIIAMFADTGIRNMELRSIRVEDVMETRILIRGKGNKERMVFISPALKRILIKYERLRKDYFKDRDTTDHYFLTYQGNGISNVGLDNVIKEAGKRANITGKRVSPHTFRHYYSVQCLMQGIDVYSLSRLLGHSDMNTTQEYLRSLTDDGLLDKAIASSPLMNLKK